MQRFGATRDSPASTRPAPGIESKTEQMAVPADGRLADSETLLSEQLAVPADGRPADSETLLLVCLPEEWRDFALEFGFTYMEVVCLMSTAPDQTRDETVLSTSVIKLELSLEISDWRQAQHLLCLLVRSDPVHAVDAMCSNRLSTVAVRAARVPESEHGAEFTRRLGKTLFSQLVAFVDRLSAPESGSATWWPRDGTSDNDCGGGAALECAGAGAPMDCGGGDGDGGA